MEILPVRLDHVSHVRAFRMPKHQAAASVILLKGEQTQILTDRSVIATLRLRLEIVVRLKLCFILPRRAVNALQHRLRFVTTPVRPSHTFERERFLIKLARGLHVRSRAQIPPLVADVINRNRLRLDGF